MGSNEVGPPGSNEVCTRYVPYYMERAILLCGYYLDLRLTLDGRRFALTLMESEFPHQQLGFMELPGGDNAACALVSAVTKLLDTHGRGGAR